MKTALALTGLALLTLLGAAACDQNSGAVPCASQASGASTDTVGGVALSTAAAEACADSAVARSTAALQGASDPSGGGSSPAGASPASASPPRRRGPN